MSSLHAQIVQTLQASVLNLTQEDGLPSNEVYNLMQDSRGNIWIATDGGLARYDGIEVKTYTNEKKIGGAVDLLREDDEGRVWCKTYTGQLFYVEDDSLQFFEGLYTLPKEFGFYDTYDFHPITHKLTLFMRENYYTYDKETGQWTMGSFSSAGKRLSGHNISFLNDGRLMFTTFGTQLWEADLKTGNARKVCEDCYGVVDCDYVGGKIDNGDGFVFREGYSSAIMRYKDNMLDTLAIIPDKDAIGIQYKFFEHPHKDVLWLTTSTGIWELNYEHPQKCIWRHYFSGYNTSTCTFDREGNYWITTLNQGVFMVPALEQIGYLRDDDKTPLDHSAFVLRQALDPTHLWLGSPDGRIIYYDTELEQVERWYKNKERKSTPLDIVEMPQYNQVWYTYNVMMAVSFPDLKPEKVPVVVSGPNQFAPYGKDTLIILTASTFGFYAMSKDKNLVAGYSREKRPLAYLRRKKHPRALWVAYMDSLVYFSDIHAPYQTARNPVDGSSVVGTALTETSDGTLWAGTDKGHLYEIRNQTEIVAHYIPKGYRLPSLICRSLATDGKTIWMGTDKGLLHFNPTTKQWQYYNKLDGLPSNQIRQILIVGAYLYAATPRGYIRIDTAYQSHNSVPPLIRLERLWINGRDTTPEAAYELPYQENSLTFKLAGVALRSQGQMTYRYRLFPLDTSWYEAPGNAPMVNYTALPAGKYHFEAVVVNEDGVVSEEPVRVEFCIGQPFWERWWFRLLGITFFTGLVSAGVYRRQQLLRKREKAAAHIQQQIQSLRLLALQSQMNPHFVFNALSSIEFFILNGQLKSALLYHGKLAKLLRQTFEYSKEPLISLEEEIEFLSLYLELENMRLNDQIDWQLRLSPEVEEESDDLLVPPMLLQPLLENSFKHGLLHRDPTGGQLRVDWVLINEPSGEEFLYVTIVDNGIGYRQSQAQETDRLPNHQSSGLDLVRQRLHLLAGDKTSLPLLRMTDLSDEGRSGTRVEVWIKIASKHQLPTNSIVSS